MAQRLKEVDVVVIGVGMVGSIVAKELAAAGYKVVGLERGQPRFTVPEFQSPAIHDELRFDVRKALMQDSARETVSFRNHGSQTALPMRRLESFLARHRAGRSPWCIGTARPTAFRPATFASRATRRSLLRQELPR